MNERLIKHVRFMTPEGCPAKTKKPRHNNGAFLTVPFTGLAPCVYWPR